MYTVQYAKDFKRAWKRLKKSGNFHEEHFRDALIFLRSGRPLPPNYRDHVLVGEYAGCRECHIRGGLLLVYEKHDDVLVLVMVDIGTHHELFGI